MTPPAEEFWAKPLKATCKGCGGKARLYANPEDMRQDWFWELANCPSCGAAIRWPKPDVQVELEL